MTIERIENGQRFCRVLRHNGTVYLAGMTADDFAEIGGWSAARVKVKEGQGDGR